MSGKNSQLTPLQTRKQLLVLESELNRVQLLNELEALKPTLGRWREQAQAISSLAANVASLTTIFSAVAKIFAPRAGGGEKKSSWISAAFNGLKTGAAAWAAFKSPPK